MQDVVDDRVENSPIYYQINSKFEHLKAVIRLRVINNKSQFDTIKKQSGMIQDLLKENEDLKNNTNNLQKIINKQ